MKAQKKIADNVFLHVAAVTRFHNKVTFEDANGNVVSYEDGSPFQLAAALEVILPLIVLLEAATSKKFSRHGCVTETKYGRITAWYREDHPRYTAG